MRLISRFLYPIRQSSDVSLNGQFYFCVSALIPFISGVCYYKLSKFPVPLSDLNSYCRNKNFKRLLRSNSFSVSPIQLISPSSGRSSTTPQVELEISAINYKLDPYPENDSSHIHVTSYQNNFSHSNTFGLQSPSLNQSSLKNISFLSPNQNYNYTPLVTTTPLVDRSIQKVFSDDLILPCTSHFPVEMFTDESSRDIFDSDHSSNMSNTCNMFIKISPSYFSLFIIFATSAIIWPSYITAINSASLQTVKSQNNIESNHSSSRLDIDRAGGAVSSGAELRCILMFLFYSIFDFLGRLFALISVVKNPMYVTIPNMNTFATIRFIVFVPVIIYSMSMHWTFDSISNVLCVILICAFGGSNGYLGAISLIDVNFWIKPGWSVEVVGFCTAMAVNLSVALGAIMATFMHIFLK